MYIDTFIFEKSFKSLFVYWLFVRVLITEYQKIIKFLACNIRSEEMKVGKSLMHKNFLLSDG